jgi:hypothetical protein
MQGQVYAVDGVQVSVVMQGQVYAVDGVQVSEIGLGVQWHCMQGKVCTVDGQPVMVLYRPQTLNPEVQILLIRCYTTLVLYRPQTLNPEVQILNQVLCDTRGDRCRIREDLRR